MEQATFEESYATGGGDFIHVRLDNGRLARFDMIWLATGGEFDMELVPLYASLQAQHPIPSAGGFPVLREDLSWAAGVPLFVMGAFAQLQLGADALNLAGARSGSVAVARALRKRMGMPAAAPAAFAASFPPEGGK